MSQTLTYTFKAPPPPLTGGMLARSDGVWIPCDLGNTEYQQFLAWIAAGNTAPAGWSGPTNPE